VKILHVIADLESRKGGPPRAVLGMCRALARAGHTVELFAMTGGNRLIEEPFGPPGSEPNGLTIRVFPRVRLFGWPVSVSLATALFRRVREFEVVHVHSLYLFHTIVASICARRAGVPYIVRPHGTLDPFLRRRGWIKKGLYNFTIERRTLNGAAAIHYTTEQEMFLSHRPLGLTSPAVVVPLGVDLEEFCDLPDPSAFRSRFLEIGDRRILLFLGRLHFKKGLDLLIESFRRVANDLPDVQLVIVGPDEDHYRRNIEGWVRNANIQDRVTFVDMLLGRQKLEAFAAASAFVLSSYTENFGLSVIEAMACGVPAIVSDRVGVAERLASAKGGDVVTCDPTDVAEALRRVLSDPDRAAEMGQRGKQLVTAEFTWDRVAGQLAAVYQRVVARGAPALPESSVLRLPATLAPNRTRPRVLQVVPGIAPGFGSPNVALLEMVKALASRGIDTTLMTTNVAPFGKVDKLLGVQTNEQGARVVYYDVWPNTRYASSSSLAKALFETASDYDLIHIHWLYNFSSLVAAKAARRAGVPYLLQPHGSLDPYLFRKNRWLKRLYLATVARGMMSGAAGIVFTTDQERDLAASRINAPSFVVPVGLEWHAFETLPERGTFRQQHPELADNPFVLFLGRICRQKGMDLLVRAFELVSKRHPALRLVIAGPDSEGYRADVEQWISDAHLTDRVHFIGYISGRLKLAAYVDSEMFLLPSYAENFGVVVTEALACGQAVVISDHVNIADEVARADAGVVTHCDAVQFADEIDRLLLDPERRTALGARGRDLVQQRYTWDVATEELLSVYSRILGTAMRPEMAVVSGLPIA
jgi:glycosyltransferase involved in cell wall biosynthesis